MVTRLVIVVAALMALAIAPAYAEPPRLTVVELYTSQGCNPCPPADAYLRDLAARDDVLPLSFHIDYWDYIGWKDPFADAENTARQRAYAGRLGLSYVYTPQMVIDGMWQGSGAARGERDKQIAMAHDTERETVAVTLESVAPNRLRLSLPAGDFDGRADINLVRFDAEQTTKILRGENRGRELTYANVVREMRRVGTWRGEALELEIELTDLGGVGDDRCAIIVQRAGQGAVLGAAMLDLRG